MSEKLQQDHFKVMSKKHEHPDHSSPGGEMNQQETDQYLAGRGAQFNTKNRFLKDERTREHIEGIDDWRKKIFLHNTSNRNQKPS